MITPHQLEQNTKVSFRSAREDIYALYNEMNRLKTEMEGLSQKNNELSLQIKKLNLELQIAKFRKQEVKEVVIEKIVKEDKKPEYVASMLADKVHDSKCVFAKNIKRINKIKFDSRLEALNNGYTVCSCLNSV
ncbi:MAG: hypothetical protein WCV90_05940 [Candidatus Woesearchaeota archaeon]